MLESFNNFLGTPNYQFWGLGILFFFPGFCEICLDFAEFDLGVSKSLIFLGLKILNWVFQSFGSVSFLVFEDTHKAKRFSLIRICRVEDQCLRIIRENWVIIWSKLGYHQGFKCN